MANNLRPLVFVDAHVNHYQQLLAGVSNNAVVQILTADEDGIATISAQLQNWPQVKDVYLVAHGLPGCLRLGNAALSLDTLNHYAPQIMSWFATATGQSPQLHLYGCNVAAGDAGEEFIRRLHHLTGAGIAASTGLVGHADLGGTWQLESTVGAVTPSQLVTPAVAATYRDVLSTGQDNFADAEELSLTDPNTGSNDGATHETGEPIHDPSALNADPPLSQTTLEGINDSIWWQWTADTTGTVTVDTIGSTFNTVLAVYTGTSVNSLTQIALNDNISTSNTRSRVTFAAEAGTTYYFAVDGSGNRVGDVQLNLNTPPVIDPNQSFTIPENTANGTVIDTVQASETGLTWSIVSGNPDGDSDGNRGFSINASTGELLVNDTDDLDFESFGPTFDLVVSASDGLLSSEETVTINVTDGADAPVITALTPSQTIVNEGVQISLSGTFNDPDVSDLHTVTINWGDGDEDVISNDNLTVLDADGNKSFANVRHTYQNDDEYTITVTVSDSVTTPATATTNISVNNVAPSITQGDTVTFNVNEDSSRTLTLNATDPGLDDTLTWNILNQPAHGVASVSTTPTGTSQVISYTPTANFNGTDTFEVQVRDPDGGADTIQVSMNVVAQPDAPSGLALSGSVNALDEGETFTLSGSFSDPDASESFTITINWGDGSTATVLSNANVVNLGNGNYTFSTNHTYTSDSGAGLFSVSAVVRDKDTLSTSASISVDVNNVDPIITEGPSLFLSTQEDAAATLVLNATDAADTDFTWSIETQPTNGTVTLTGNPNGPSSQAFTYTPDTNFDSIDTFEVRVEDGDGGFSISSVLVEVNGEDDPPTNLSISPDVTTLNEGSTLSLDGSFLDVDSDESHTVTINWGDGSNPTILDSADLGAPVNDTYSFAGLTHTYVDDGTFSLSVLVEDVAGATVSTTETITVSNLAPEINYQGSLASTSISLPQINEDTPTTFALDFTDDGADDVMQWSIQTAPTLGKVVIQPAVAGQPQSFVYTPNLNVSGNDSFVVRLSDGDGGLDTVEVLLTVAAVNDLPQITANQFAITEGQSLAINQSILNATDVETFDDNLAFTITGLSAGERFAVDGGTDNTFTLADIIAGDVTFIDNGDETAPAFTIAVSDANSGVTTVAGNVTFTPVNDAPVITTSAFTVAEGATITLNSNGVNLAATDEETDDDTLTYTLTNLVAGTLKVNGLEDDTFTQAQLNSGAVTFTHDGTETQPVMAFTVSDGQVSTSGSATITLTPVFDPPELINNSLTVTEGEATLITLANFDATDPDTDDNALTFVVPASIPGGEFQLLNLGTGLYETVTEFTRLNIINERVRFLHDGDNVAPVFTITVRDISALTDTADAQVTFNPVNDAPTFVTNFLTISEGQSVVLSDSDISATDEETADAGTLAFTVESVTGGQFEFTNAPGTEIFGFTQQQINDSQVRFVDNGDEVKPAYTLSVSDGEASTSSAATVFFTNLNDAPRFLANNLTVGEGQTVTLSTLNLDATDVDNADSGLQFTITGLDTNVGVFLVNGTESTTFTRAQIVNQLVQYQHKGSNAAPSYTVEVTDGVIATPVTSQPTITFNATNDLPIIQTNTLTITEGETVTLTPADLTATDEETNDPDLQYTVLNSVDGTVPGGQFIDDLGNGITTFTQDDVTDGRVRFAHDGSETEPAYTLQVSDGVNTVTSSVTPTFTRVNDAPTFTANQLTLDEGQTIAITTSNLNASDVDFGYDNNNLSFTIVGLDPTIGEFLVGGTSATTFTLGDIVNNRVQFEHKGTNEAPSYTVQLTDGTIATPITGTPVITFNAENDLPVVEVNALTIDEGEIVTLNSTDHLRTTDEETDDAAIQYTVESVTGGRFLNPSDVTITSFTQGDIDNGLVRFEHLGDEAAPTYTLGVSDGTISISDPADITFNNLDDPPVLIRNRLTINEGQTRLVTTADIDASDIEDNDNTLTFAVGQLVNEVFTESATFAGGEFQLKDANGVFNPTSSFTRLNIINQRVRFVHFGEEIAPQYAIQVTDSEAASTASQAQVTFNPVNDLPTVTVNRLIIDEEGVFVFNTNLADPDLAATDEETDDALIEYNVASVTGGQFEEAGTPGVEIFSFTQEQVDLGNIRFVHDGNEAAPTYTLNVDDGQAGVISSVGQVTFTSVNDAPVLETNTLTLTEGDTVVLTTANLNASDIETNNNDLEFAITAVTGGFFEFTDGTLIADPTTPNAATFTLQDVILEQVRFVQSPEFEEITPSYTVAVTDDDATNPQTTTGNGVVNFTPINDAPEIITNSLTITEGSIAIFDDVASTTQPNFGVLVSTDPESAPADLQYTVSEVAGGQFEIVTAPGVEVFTFSQAQINNRQVRFVQDSTSTVPTYVVTVSDGELTAVDETPDVDFTDVNDPPTLTTNQLTITEGQTVVLGSANINYSDEESSPEQISYEVTTGPVGGQFERVTNPGVAITTFSQNDINIGAIQFVQDDTDTEPSYTLTLTDNAGATTSLSATVTFTPINDAPVVQTNELTIDEAGTANLLGNLVSTDEETDNGDLAYSVESVTNGQFELVAAPGTAITSFTQTQVDDGDVQFAHDANAGEAEPTYSLRVTDGGGNSVVNEGQITFNRTNDDPSFDVNTLTIEEGATVTLSTANLLATDEEDGATDLTYTVTGDPVAGGKFVLTSDATQTAITEFTQAQVETGAIQFVQDGTETTPAYTLTVTDSEGGTAVLAADVTFTPLNDLPDFQTNILTLNEGDTIILNAGTTVNLFTEDEESGPADLDYTVQSVTGGRFELVAAPGTAITTFTQEQVDAEAVQFVHLGGESAPTYNLIVSDGDATATLASTINFTNVNDAPEFLASQLFVTEGETLTLGLSNINATDPDNDDRNIQFSITNVTGGGTFYLQGVALTETDTFTRANLNFGDLVFEDDGDEIAPSFDITATDPNGAANTVSATTELIPVNDVPVLNVNSFDITEGERITLSDANLSASDEESDDAQLVYLLSGIVGGQFFNDAGDEIFSFTQAQLNDGNQIFFEHDDSNTVPAFNVTISDPLNGVTDPIAANIAFTPINDAPTFTRNALTIAEGQTVTLTTNNIQVDDSDTPLSQLLFTIDSVANGTFTLSGTALAQGDTFTRNDLVFNRIGFIASDDGSTPAYTLTVSDQDATDPKTATLAATVNFTPVDDPPTFAVNNFPITEDQDLQLSSANLQAADEETTDPSRFTYVVSNLSGGTFFNVGIDSEVQQFTQLDVNQGLIFFTYGGGEVSPTFSFSLSDEGNNVVTQAGNITFTSVDDPPTLDVNAFPIDQGEVITLSTAYLSASDNDTQPSGLTYTISSASGVQFNRDNNLDGEADETGITSFTQRELLDGKIILVDDDDNNAPSFDIAVADATTTVGPVAAAIDFVDLNDEPTALTLSLSSSTIDEGDSVTLNGGFTDPDSSIHSATIDWGDGSTDTLPADQIINNGNGTFSLESIDHTYADDGSYTVTLQVSDGDGNNAEPTTAAVTVSEVAPTASITVSDPTEADKLFTLTIGQPVDPGDDPIVSYLVDWGNGTQTLTTEPGEITKVYKDSGTFTITVTATDDDGKTFELGTPTAEILYPVTDFDKDGDADLLWRSNGGTNLMWLLGEPEGTVRLTDVSPGFEIEALKDFNFDGSEDILWRDATSSTNIIWLFDGINPSSSISLSPLGAEFELVTVSDFDNDGGQDLLWRNGVSGENVIWRLLQNGYELAEVNLPTVDVSYSLVGASDFNSDGFDDLLWRQASSGTNIVWLMEGTAPTGQTLALPQVDAAYTIAEIADFNNDNYDDLFWRDASSGTNVIWLMGNSGSVSTVEILPAVSGDYAVAGVTDFNGDNHSDILWRNGSNGDTRIWLMDGAQPSSELDIADPPSGWNVYV
jgi:hypothetical protein